MSFATAINCIDGRVQTPVIDFVRRRFRVHYVDLVTEPSPVRVLSLQDDRRALKSITTRLDLSVKVHDVESVALVAHHDCKANPIDDLQQQDQLHRAVETLGKRYAKLEIVGVWVNFSWGATEWCRRSRGGEMTRYG